MSWQFHSQISTCNRTFVHTKTYDHSKFIHNNKNSDYTCHDLIHMQCPERPNLYRQKADSGCLELGVRTGIEGKQSHGIFSGSWEYYTTGLWLQLYTFIKCPKMCVNFMIYVLILSCFCNKLPKAFWLKIIQISYFADLWI